jgi:hypothetical protein
MATNLEVDSPLAPKERPEEAPRQTAAQQPPQANGGNGAAQAKPEPEPAIEDRPPPGAWVNGRAILPLRKNVQAHGEMIDHLEFREPTGGDIERIGNPVILSIFEANPKPVYDAAIMTLMMSHLAQVPTSTIRSMASRDWNNGALMLFNFFVPDRWIT